MAGAGIAIGLPIHNGAQHLRQAVDSLLVQSHRDFRLVLLDDGSVDGSDAIAEEYVRRDGRISFLRNSSRTGLVRAWKRVAEVAGDGHPHYFAWCSDHDWVAPDWLERLREALQEQPGAVLAHAHTLHVNTDGSPTGIEGHPLDTAKMEPYEQLRTATLGTLGAGDAVYGLFRFEALCRCGIFPREILPDRLVVSELSLLGTITHVASTARFRRVFPDGDAPADLIRRQLSRLFAPGEAPLRPHLGHATYFLRRFLPAPANEPPARRMQQLYHALLYFQRHFNRYRAECGAELESPEGFGDLAPLVDFLRAVRERNWMDLDRDHAVLAESLRDAQAQVRQLETERDGLQDEIRELRVRNAEAEVRNAEAEIQLEELRHPVRRLIRKAASVLRGILAS
jgi:glycosyltransferase involved in cell wall biosynthesis